MTLTGAISIIARVHTRTAPYGIGADDARHFEIVVGATPNGWDSGVTQADYVEAWSVLRENAGMMPERNHG